MAWLLNDLDPFSSVHLTVAVALNRLRQELARWRPEERADKLDECFRRLRHRPLPHRDPEQHQTGRTRGREGNKHFSPKANQLGDDHGFASRPVIVRDARDRCVFVGTKLQAGHVIGRFPIDDRETLRAYWPELNDEQMNVAKTFALAHAVGESPAGAFPDEAVADDLVKLRDNLAWDLPETETWKSLKADVPPAVEDEQVLRWRVVNP